MAIISKVYARRKNKPSKVSKILQLPTDLVLDIISRLPVKSVLRFKSVSKSCYNIIKNPSFIKKHQEYANLNPNPIFNAILSVVNEKTILRINLMEDLEKPIDLDFPFLSGCNGIRVLGICNGLVCLVLLVSKSSRVCICNPLTGEFRLVPGIGEGCTYFQFSGEDEFTMYLGFCLNGDKGYELFKIVYQYFPVNGKLVLEGAAYSLTTNTWREINVKKGDFKYLGDHSKSCNNYHIMPVFEHGVFYWGATDFNSAYIVSFDVEKEVFDEFLTPSDCNDEGWILFDLKGEAAVVVYHHDSVSFDIWVLDETQKNWVTKLEEENHGFGIRFTVLGCVNSDELVVQDYVDNMLTLFLYNTDSGDIDVLPYVIAETIAMFSCTLSRWFQSMVLIMKRDVVRTKKGNLWRM